MKEKGRSLDVVAALSAAAAGLLKEAGVEVPDGAEARFTVVKKALRSRQTETFPLADLGIKDLDSWELKNVGLGTATKKLEEQRAKVEKEVERVIPLFEAALKLEAIDRATEPQTCPLCEDGTLSIERVAAIRAKLRETNEFRTAETSARSAISMLASTVWGSKRQCGPRPPNLRKIFKQARKGRGFDVARARRLAGSEGSKW